MNKMLAIGTSVFFTLFAGAAGAVEAHHPAAAKPVVSSTSKSAMPPAKQSGEAGMQTQQMDQMMQRMQDMHDKMMSAKTPEERQKLMDEHRTLMQDGMVMMKSMGGKGCSMMSGAGAGGMMMGQDAMEKRMDMMQMMMQMMMDRESAAMPMAK
ncbi:MAG: hypothetical protein ABI476_06260 [Oxalobacteraceae bacterium]